MKKIISAAIVLFAALSASAQYYAGGSFAIDRNTTDNVTEFIIAPEVGYGINDNWAVGVSLGYDHTYNDGLKTDIFEVNPYARYTYFKTDNNLVNLFIDGGFGIGFGKSKNEDYKSETITAYNIGFKPGVALNLSEKFAVVAHFGFLGYEGGNDAAKEANIPEKLGLNFSTMNLDLGFYINF